MFITFEGTDGTGKTTQIMQLKQYFERLGQRVLVTREPGGCPIAEKIRELLLDKNNAMDDVTEAYLYAAARAEHVRTVIRPALERGEVVLCDRFIDSSVAYQGYGRGLTAKTVLSINQLAMDGCLPDRTYLLTLLQETAQRRVEHRGQQDRMESAGADFAQRVAIGFEETAKIQSERFRIIDASLSIESIAAIIVEDVAKLQTEKGAGC